MIHKIIFATNSDEDTLQQFQNMLLMIGIQINHLKSEGKLNYGTIYQLRNHKYLSDAEIGSLFDISESTVTRRRKKHISNGNFYDGSNIVF